MNEPSESIKSDLPVNDLNKKEFLSYPSFAGEILRTIPPKYLTSINPRKIAARKSNLIAPLISVKKSTIANG